LGGRQEGVVLSDSSPWVPTNSSSADAHRASADAHRASADAHLAACEACRSIQLRRWLRELASRLVSTEETMVL